MVKAFLPDIIENIVARVDASFTDRPVDPFGVFFEKGLIQQVKRSVYKADGNFPLVWLVYKYNEQFGNTPGHADANFILVLAVPTDNKYTQQERDDISYKPRLFPICEQLIYEIQREKWFTSGYNLRYTREVAPFWGIGDVNGQDSEDVLFKGKAVDTIFLTVSVKVKEQMRCLINGGYSVPDTTGYPIIEPMLTFYDDIELIVDGGNPTDPVDGATSVIIPETIGTDFEVYQRAIGQLRRQRSIEVVPDTVNGGFFLVGSQFNATDTYIVKRRPQYLPSN